jgi:hypothetical protein
MYVTTIAALGYTGIKALMAAFAGTKVTGNIIAGVIALVLIACALILGYDGAKALRRKGEAVPAK